MAYMGGPRVARGLPRLEVAWRFHSVRGFTSVYGEPPWARAHPSSRARAELALIMLLALATAEALILPTPTSTAAAAFTCSRAKRGARGRPNPSRAAAGAAALEEPARTARPRRAVAARPRERRPRRGAGHDVPGRHRGLQAADPALYAKMAAQQGGGALSADVHEKLVELTWDTVAAYMPATAAAAGGLSSTVAKKLELVAACCCAEAGGAVLDVGCGDGSTLPFLRGAGADDARYCGLDLSGRMIAAARAAHPAATFEQAGFFGAALAAPPRRYDCVLFNGSLHSLETSRRRSRARPRSSSRRAPRASSSPTSTAAPSSATRPRATPPPSSRRCRRSTSWLRSRRLASRCAGRWRWVRHAAPRATPPRSSSFTWRRSSGDDATFMFRLSASVPRPSASRWP